MEEKKIACSLITPVFSFGAYENAPELRTSELKGAMRYMYRIACLADLEILAADEAELFGSAAGSGKNAGHASPVRLLMQGNLQKKVEPLLLHKPKKKTLMCFFCGNFDITVRPNLAGLGPKASFHGIVDLAWYEDLIKLSLIICGLGRRSRKGRGSLEIDGLNFQSKQDFLQWLCLKLNKAASASSSQIINVFEIGDQEIVNFFVFDRRKVPVIQKKGIQRPVIQKIRLGKKLRKDQIDKYLGDLDYQCHELKDNHIALPKEISGIYHGKFASPLLTRIVRIQDSYYPLYIYLKGVNRYKIIDPHCSDRDAFIKIVENTKREVLR